VPVRITHIEVENEAMTLTLAPMDAKQREKARQEILRAG
jgi:hypothetical protein